MKQCLVGIYVQLLLRFTLYVRFSCTAEHIEQASLPYLRLDHFRRKSDGRKQPREDPLCFGMMSDLFFLDVLLSGYNHNFLSRNASRCTAVTVRACASISGLL